jgi:hypothetical protein
MTETELAVARILGTVHTLADVARDYRIPAATLHSARKAHKFVCTKIGTGVHSLWLVDPDSFAAWHKVYLERQARKLPACVKAAATNAPLRDEWDDAEGEP